MTLKTLKAKERLINYKVFRYICQVNMLQKIKEIVLFVEKNINQPMEEVKLVQRNVRKKEKEDMIKNILNNIQRFQELLQKIGNKIIKIKLMKGQKNDGGKTRNFKLEIIPMNLLEEKEFQNMGSVNYVGNYQRGKSIILNMQRRILF